MSNSKDAVRKILDAVKADKRTSLTAPEGKLVCDAYGIPVPKEGVAKSAADAARIATDMGFPVVMKIVSPDILHKTEAGGVMVGVKTDRKSTRLNSSHLYISYAVFCLKKNNLFMIARRRVGRKQEIIDLDTNPFELTSCTLQLSRRVCLMPWPALPSLLFFFNDTATTEIYTLSLHDALPICLWDGHAWMQVPHDQGADFFGIWGRSEEHTSELQSPIHLVCRLLLEQTHAYLFYAQFLAYYHQVPCALDILALC